MAVLLSPVGGVAAQFFTNAGVPLSGGKIYTYTAGTSTPQATYTTGAGNIQHSNPIVLDAAGRVPTGEIWLTDGLSYKFVLKDNNDVLIATYDNIVGINSNFVNFVNQQEIQTATAGQTVFNLTTMEYQPGTGNLSVFVDGVNQYGPGAQYAYTETDSNTVTFVSGLHVGASVKFTTTQIQNSGVADASQITYTYPAVDAVEQSVEDRLAQYVSVKDFGATGDGVTDDTAAIQSALDSGALVVDFLGIECLCDEIEIPANVSVINLNLKKKTAGGNLIIVNTGCSLQGKITGTATTGIVERGVYPAANNVTDVVFNLDIIDFERGVHGQPPVSGTAYSDAPKRWSGSLRLTNIAGATGSSEGYGLLLSPGHNCVFDIISNSPNARHIVYLSAGASHNQINANVNGCTNYAAQIYSTGTQPYCEWNTVNIDCLNLTETVSGQSGAIAIVGRCNFNNTTFNVSGGGVLTQAVLIEGSSGGAYPYGNKIVNSTAYGEFTGVSVIKMINADSTIVSDNVFECYSTNDVIGMRRSGTNGSTHGGYIEGNYINGLGQNVVGVYDECTTQPSFVGINQITNNGSSLRVNDQTSGKRQGYSRRLTFSGTTPSVNATETLDVTITLPDTMQTTGRKGFVNLTGASVQFFNAPFWSALTSASTETTQIMRVYNPAAAAQTIDYSGVVEGD